MQQGPGLWREGAMVMPAADKGQIPLPFICDFFFSFHLGRETVGQSLVPGCIL
jgi:hypothetical protein